MVYRLCRVRKISIHTPAKGVTTSYQNPENTTQDFNPHSREGSDGMEFKHIPKYYISIHTPAKGVTGMKSMTSPEIQISIHTPAKGVTLHQ